MKKILLAIDDDLLREIFSRKLIKSEFKVFPAQTKKEIFEILRKKKVDLILIDVALDNISGLEVVKIIKKEKKITSPVFVFSAIGEENLREKAIKLGVKNFIVGTETSPKELVSTIKSFLK